MTNATEAYREEMDILAAFFSDRCDLDRVHTVSKGELYEAYKGWCANSGERAVTKKEFGTKMKERGFEGKKSGGWVWMGIRVTPEPPLTVSGHQPSQEGQSGLDTLDILDMRSGMNRIHESLRIENPKNMSNMSNTSTGDDPTTHEIAADTILKQLLLDQNEWGRPGTFDAPTVRAGLKEGEYDTFGDFDLPTIEAAIEMLLERGEVRKVCWNRAETWYILKTECPVTYPADLEAPIEALTQELLYESSMGRANTFEEAAEMFIEPIHDGETYYADFVPERWQVQAAWSEVMELTA